MAVIETHNLTKIYGSGEASVTALEDVSIEVEMGEIVAVMGPSGCGKSTLLHLLGGLDRPTRGSVSIGGRDLSTLSDNQLTELRRRKIGFVFQFFNLIPVMNSVENAALPLMLDGVRPVAAKDQAADWLTRIGIGDRLENRPDQLSGGQQQRVAIARALIAGPDIVLADEPTGNLDTHAGDEIAGILRQVSKEWKRTVVMVTHDPRIAVYADRIILLKDGQVVDQTVLEPQNNRNAEVVMEKMKGLG
jgi:putative ABC transport system ATP-binding protein